MITAGKPVTSMIKSDDELTVFLNRSITIWLALGTIVSSFGLS